MIRTQSQTEVRKAVLEMVVMDGDQYYKIPFVNTLRPFFMSVVSNANHWMFLSSNGGLTAGRKDADRALFPYYTVDKIKESAQVTGSLTAIRVIEGATEELWEPFREGDLDPDIQRNLYKSPYGNRVQFEEIHHRLGLIFRYTWSFSEKYGFVRQSFVDNIGELGRTIEVLDGLTNIIPANVPSDLQVRASNLVDAYKRSELDTTSGMGIYALSAIIVDKAEPSESLRANIAWSTGIESPTYLLSTSQVQDFRRGYSIQQETDVKGEKGAYLLQFQLSLAPNTSSDWIIAADVHKDHSEVIALADHIQTASDLPALIKQDVEHGREHLLSLVSSADGVQKTADHLRDARHFSNVLFNIMRGGIFEDHYAISKKDFQTYLHKANVELGKAYKGWVQGLEGKEDLLTFRDSLAAHEDPDLLRLGVEYLPLMFSRRHGDPSRPWNQFSINTQDEQSGERILDYQGNWRDIFQNWEALAISFPEFLDGMIFKFLNASTFEGYNPYRIFKDGFDWETIEEDDPWSYIGYWGDHQIIYLLKFLEALEHKTPGRLLSYLGQECFVYAAVPYKIKPYEDVVENPKDTIMFDAQWDESIRQRRDQMGSDGALLFDESGELIRVNMLEKLLASALAKLSNFIPDGGIWMNTQRPEWNDANNALVGNGVSMVTLCYLRRYLAFLQDLLSKSTHDQIKVSGEFVDYYHGIRQAFSKEAKSGRQAWTPQDRKSFMDAIGTVASDYRDRIYQVGFWGKKRSIGISNVLIFLEETLSVIDATIEDNQRPDLMYHAYNLVTIDDQGAHISHLDEMLEGQVAILSAGLLQAKHSLEVLDAMKGSALFRPDQYSYLLYPNKDIPGFLERNNISEEHVSKSPLLQQLLEESNTDIICKDIKGGYHFNASFKNANDLARALDELPRKQHSQVSEAQKEAVLRIFEEVFEHKSFTGRSGTFFGYEGLGSIYWHMVSKLLVAVQECAQKAIAKGEEPKVLGGLLDHYYEIQAGIGVHKSPSLYGAFPTDPYSHTPGGRGAQQPGMTGQVKEDILVRFGELGVHVDQGKIRFYPHLLRQSREFLAQDSTYRYYNLQGDLAAIPLDVGQLAFTYCQVPVIYQISDSDKMDIYTTQETTQLSGLELPLEISREIQQRTGLVEKIVVHVPQSYLK